MCPDCIKGKSLYDVLLKVLRRMSMEDSAEVLTMYWKCVEQNGGSKEYASECAAELLVDYLDK